MLYTPDCKIYKIRDFKLLWGIEITPVPESKKLFADPEIFVVCEELPRYRGMDDMLLLSNYGRLFSMNARCFINTNKKNGKYRVIYASQGHGKRRAFYIHKLVAKYFVAGYEPELKVKFIDNDTSNVASYNLMWVTNGELSIINSIMNNPSDKNMKKKIMSLYKDGYTSTDIVNLLYDYLPGRNYIMKKLFVHKLTKKEDTDN